MKTIQRDAIVNVSKALTALAAAGIKVITARSSMVDGSQVLAARCEILITDESDQAAAQAILDAFDPVVAQSEVSTEAAAETERQAFLKLIKDKWLTEFIPLRNWARTKGYPG